MELKSLSPSVTMIPSPEWTSELEGKIPSSRIAGALLVGAVHSIESMIRRVD